MSAGNGQEAEQLHFYSEWSAQAHYTKCIPPLAVFVCDGVQMNRFTAESLNESRARKTMEVGDWFEVELLYSIQGILNVVRARFSIDLFTSEHYWCQHRFNPNLFFRSAGKEVTFNSDKDK